jgi:hypothetical protein
VPVPVPVFVTAIALYPGATSNAALIVRSSVMVTAQGPVPLHPPPLHPLNKVPTPWLVVKVTDAPISNGSTQSAPQLIPAGALTTIPFVANGPLLVIVRIGVLVSRNCAETVDVFVTAHSPPPVHAPAHCTNDQFGCGMAENITFVSASNRAEQVALHSMPEGLDLTVPPPDGTIVIVTSIVGASAISTETVVPGVRSVSVFPENSLVPAAFNAETEIRRCGPDGAFIERVTV